jgi:hypothetical protein
MMDAAEKQAAQNAMMNLVDAATADVAAFSSQ